MIRDRASYFNIDMRNVNTVPKQLIDGIEAELPRILAQTPAEDKLELYTKYYSKSIDNNAITPPSSDLVNTLNDINNRLQALEHKLK